MSFAWVYFHGAQAGLTRRETANLPIGQVYDQIDCWLIEERGLQQKGVACDVFDF